METKPINSFAERVVERAKNNLVTPRRVGGKLRTISSTGRLASGLGYQVKLENDSIVIRWTSLVEYARFVNEGRNPGKQPPIHEIENWIRNKKLRIRNLKTGQFQTKQGERGEKNIRQAAYLIARKIGREGIPATNFFNDAIEDELDELPTAVLQWMQQQVELRFEKFTK